MTPASLKKWPLPPTNQDKEGRGRILVIGGAAELPGSALLTGIAALRAGGGKLQMAVSARVAIPLAVEIPEAMVLPIRETARGKMRVHADDALFDYAEEAQAVVLGPGLTDPHFCEGMIAALIPRLKKSTLIIDAGALKNLREDRRVLHPLRGRAVATPHLGEMAGLLGIEKSKVKREARDIALRFSRDVNAVTVLKGLETWVASPDGEIYHQASGHSGLGTSGSGDVLAGIIAGLSARGLTPMGAAAWGVFLHGQAGKILGRSIGGTGYLARELLAEIPRAMRGR